MAAYNDNDLHETAHVLAYPTPSAEGGAALLLSWRCPKCGGREKSEPLYVPKGSLPRLRELHGAVTMAALRAEAGTTGATEDCLYWSCKTCGFVWHELCKDAQETIYAQ